MSLLQGSYVVLCFKPVGMLSGVTFVRLAHWQDSFVYATQLWKGCL